MRDRVIFGLMFAGNLVFFAAYLMGMFWKQKPEVLLAREISRLETRPGDIVVVKIASRAFSDESVMRLKGYFEHIAEGKDIKFVFISEEISIDSVVSGNQGDQK